MLNEDYRDMLQALYDEKVRFILVGAYALAAHGYPRATMDIDIWVMPSSKMVESMQKYMAIIACCPRDSLTPSNISLKEKN